jgi:hypothetical protein
LAFFLFSCSNQNTTSDTNKEVSTGGIVMEDSVNNTSQFVEKAETISAGEFALANQKRKEETKNDKPQSNLSTSNDDELISADDM